MNALADSELSPIARHVGLTLALNMDNETLEAFPSLRTLARRTGRSKNTVLRGRNELRDAGFLDWEPGGGLRDNGTGKSTRYYGNVPTGKGAAMEPSVAARRVPSSQTKGDSSHKDGCRASPVKGAVSEPGTSQELLNELPIGTLEGGEANEGGDVERSSANARGRRRLFMDARELGLSDAEVEALAHEITGKPIRELDVAGLEELANAIRPQLDGTGDDIPF